MYQFYLVDLKKTKNKKKKQSDPWKLDSHLESNLFSPSEISWFTRGKLINTQFKHQFSVKMMG